MQELGVSTNANYKITFMLDSAAMITVHTPRRGLIDVSTSSAPNLFLPSAGIFSHSFKIFNKKCCSGVFMQENCKNLGTTDFFFLQKVSVLNGICRCHSFQISR